MYSTSLPCLLEENSFVESDEHDNVSLPTNDFPAPWWRQKKPLASYSKRRRHSDSHLISEPKGESKTVETPLLPTSLCDLVLKYLGLHNVRLKPIFQTTLCASPDLVKWMSSTHRHLAVEPPDEVRRVLA